MIPSNRRKRAILRNRRNGREAKLLARHLRILDRHLAEMRGRVRIIAQMVRPPGVSPEQMDQTVTAMFLRSRR